MPVVNVCKHCGVEFKVPPVRAKTARFCSRECKYAGADWAKKIKVNICEVCGTEFKVQGAHAKRGQGRYCSLSCLARSKQVIEDIDQARQWYEEGLSFADIAKKLGCATMTVKRTFVRHGIRARTLSESQRNKTAQGKCVAENNANWKGGKIVNSKGYVELYMPGHRLATKRKYVLEHRLVWEESNNKRLPKGWEVHHLNGMRDDNRPENLAAMTKAAHSRLHNNVEYERMKNRLQERIRELEARVAELEQS